MWYTSIHVTRMALRVWLKGNASRAASWPTKVENVLAFPFAGFTGLLCQYLCNRSTLFWFFFFLLWKSITSGCSPFGLLFMNEKQEKVAYDVMYTPVTCAGLVRHHWLPDRIWQKTRLSFCDFWTSIFNKLDHTLTEKLHWVYFLFLCCR